MADLESRATEVSVEGDSLGELVCRRSVDLCYEGQSYTLNVPWQGPLSRLQHSGRFMSALWLFAYQQCRAGEYLR